MLDEVERIIAVRDAGFGVRAAELTPIQFECVVEWERQVAEWRRAHEARVKALFESLLRH